MKAKTFIKNKHDNVEIKEWIPRQKNCDVETGETMLLILSKYNSKLNIISGEIIKNLVLQMPCFFSTPGEKHK